MGKALDSLSSSSASALAAGTDIDARFSNFLSLRLSAFFWLRSLAAASNAAIALSASVCACDFGVVTASAESAAAVTASDADGCVLGSEASDAAATADGDAEEGSAATGSVAYDAWSSAATCDSTDGAATSADFRVREMERAVTLTAATGLDTVAAATSAAGARRVSEIIRVAAGTMAATLAAVSLELPLPLPAEALGEATAAAPFDRDKDRVRPAEAGAIFVASG